LISLSAITAIHNSNPIDTMVTSDEKTAVVTYDAR
jgi:hypothetical protein